MSQIQYRLMALIVSGVFVLSLGGCFPGQFPVPEEKNKPVVSPKGASNTTPFGSGAAVPSVGGGKDGGASD